MLPCVRYYDIGKQYPKRKRATYMPEETIKQAKRKIAVLDALHDCVIVSPNDLILWLTDHRDSYDVRCILKLARLHISAWQ